jgi:Sec-independent protein secretion pathway component TatC
MCLLYEAGLLLARFIRTGEKHQTDLTTQGEV